MRREGIQWRNVLRKNRVPRDLAGFVDQAQRRSRQCGNMQGLANVAGSVRAASVLVNKAAATGEIQENKAA